MTLTSELLATLRAKAEAAREAHPDPWRPNPVSQRHPELGGWVDGVANCGWDGELPITAVDYIAAANPAVVLALLDRLANAERDRDDYDDAARHQREAFQVARAELKERIAALERLNEQSLRLAEDANAHHSEAMALEAERGADLCGCGRASYSRGDPECSGCEKDCYVCECVPLSSGGT